MSNVRAENDLRTSGPVLRVPQVAVPVDILTELCTCALLCPGEIMGFGHAAYDSGLLVVLELYIPPQESTAGSALASEQDMAHFMAELLEGGVDSGRLNTWWHSHPGSVFWSATDLDTMVQGFPQAPWMLFLEFNLRHEFKAACRLNWPVAGLVDDLPVVRYADPVRRAALVEEIGRKVRVGQGPGWVAEESGRLLELTAGLPLGGIDPGGVRRAALAADWHGPGGRDRPWWTSDRRP